MNWKRLALIGWGIVFVVGGAWAYDATRTPSNAEELEALKGQISRLRDTLTVRDQRIVEAEGHVRRADSLASVVEIEARVEADAAIREANAVAADFRRRIADQPDLVARFDSVTAAHDAALAAERARYDRMNALRLGQISSRDSALVEYRAQIQTQRELISAVERERDIWKAEARPSFGIRLLRGAGRVGAASLGAWVGDQVAPDNDLGPPIGAAAALIAYESI